MTKVSILTFHFSNNLGAMLQAYGLVQAIRNIGHEVEVIDYRPLSIRKICESPLWRHRHPVRLMRTALFRHRIRDFRNKYLPMTRTYLDAEELRQSPPETDCIVVGSDQVWNIKSPVRGYDPTFFLDFLAENGPRRVSYAASFGNGTELNGHREQISGLLSRFDHISVRDVTSQIMVRDLIGQSPEHVLDPTFLTDYDPITPPPLVKQPYILTYCFRKTEASMRAVSMLRHKLNMPIVSITMGFDGARMVYPGPLQWLSLMKHASYVCTDSFHGTCFSVINRKQFMTFHFNNGNSRSEDLLHSANLSHRLINDANELKYQINVPIDYASVCSRIKEARKQSLTFLCGAFK